MTDKEIIDAISEVVAEKGYLRGHRTGELLRAAAERIMVLGEEVAAAKNLIEWTVDPEHERGRDNGFDEWEAARAATDAARRGA